MSLLFGEETMGNFDSKQLIIYDSTKDKEPFEDFVKKQQDKEFEGYIFHSIQRDAKGNSGGNPTWGNLYQLKNQQSYLIGKCIFKCQDYDEQYGPYSEKLWSLLGKKVLKDTQIRIPEILLVEYVSYGCKENGLMSFIILDNNKEDMMDFKDMLYCKYEREQIKKMKSVTNFQDLLESAKSIVSTEENYREIEKQIVRVLLLDAVTNNADRHGRNWALIRDKANNYCRLGVFDHTSSFLDMLVDRPFATNGSYWTSTYTRVYPKNYSTGIGDSGDIVLKYLFENYPEEAEIFFKNFSEALPEFNTNLEEAQGKINIRKIMSNLNAKKRIMEKILLKQRGEELEYE